MTKSALHRSGNRELDDALHVSLRSLAANTVRSLKVIKCTNVSSTTNAIMLECRSYTVIIAAI